MRRYGLYLRDLSHERTRSHGIVNYSLGLATALAAAAQPDEQVVLLANTEIVSALPPAGDRVEVHAAGPPARGVRRLLVDHTAAMTAARHDLSLLHFPKGFLPLIKPGATPLVATLHDDIPVRYWEGAWGAGHRTAKNGYFAWNVRPTARRADLLLTVSDFTRRALQQRWPGLEAVVTGQAVTLPATATVPLRDRQRIALIFGSALPHKRTAEGLAAILDWIDAHPDGGIDEVHVLGSVGEHVGIAAHPKLRMLSGHRSNHDIAALLASARVLIFPSVYEGFGLPPLEAALARTPVVFARIPAVVEVLDDAATGGYDAGSPDSFAEAMTRELALDDDALERRAERLAQRHRWDAVAEATLTAYRRLLQPPSRTP